MPTALAVAERLQRLLVANRLVGQDLELTAVLRHIVEAATELVGATYGAIGIVGADGLLEQVIQVGEAGEADATAPPPSEEGLLGALVADPRPIRSSTSAGDPRAVGLSTHQPEMSSFLGVPVRVREEVLGYLYLADRRPDAFTPADEGLVESLAATAGVSISHARLFQESLCREEWSKASVQLTHELLTIDPEDALELVARRVSELARVDLVAVVLPVQPGQLDGDLVVDHAVGEQRGTVIGTRFPAGDTMVGLCMRTGHPQVRDSVTSVSRLPRSSLGPAMAVPLLAAAGVRGSLFMMRDRGAHPFTSFDVDLVTSFAGQAALALERADARLVGIRARTLEERDRIARDLHDHVVQRLFAAGLNIQSVCTTLGPGPEVDRLNAQIDEIDATIRQIRTTIFGLNRPAQRSTGVRSEVLAVVGATTVLLPGPPEVVFRGPLDLLVPAELYADLVAVVREGLTNVGRHAAASRVEVLVEVDAHDVAVEVLDDGGGIDSRAPMSGLRNLARRAATLGGSFEVGPRDERGTRLRWTVPLPAADMPTTK